MNKELVSIYSPYLKKFIDLKRALGYKYVTNSIILSQIDELAAARGELAIGFTKSFADHWSEWRPSETYWSRYNRIRMFIDFAVFLSDMGIKTFIPNLPRYKLASFAPYIYSEEQINAIFKACDEMRVSNQVKNNCTICLPAFFRLLYGTGMRIGEACQLKDNDVNLREHWLKIRDSKNGKDRIIPISESLSANLKTYVRYRDKIPLNKSKPDFFFMRPDGSKIMERTVRRRFRTCLDLVGIPFSGRFHGPRVHDLRHTFAVMALVNMVRAGKDIYVVLPILSNYLGHQRIESTNGYVRLTINIYPELMKHIDVDCLDVFPTYKTYETH